MNGLDHITFTNNPVASGERYCEIRVNLSAIVKSWSNSIFSFEWLRPDGTIKPLGELTEREQEKRKTVEEAVKAGTALEKPVLGIGLEDNVEIGSGRAVLLTLADLGLASMPVHIRISNESDFKSLTATVDS